MSDRIGTIVVEVHIPDGEDYDRALNQAADAVERGLMGTGFTYEIAVQPQRPRTASVSPRRIPLDQLGPQIPYDRQEL